MMCRFYLGLKVTPRNLHSGEWSSPNWPTPIPGPHPKHGGVYIITALFIDPREPDHAALRLQGCSSVGYHADCFEPVIDKKTNINIFTEMLTPELEKT